MNCLPYCTVSYCLLWSWGEESVYTLLCQNIIAIYPSTLQRSLPFNHVLFSLEHVLYPSRLFFTLWVKWTCSSHLVNLSTCTIQRGRSKLRRWGASEGGCVRSTPLLNSPLPQLSKVGGKLPPLPPLLLPLCYWCQFSGGRAPMLKILGGCRWCMLMKRTPSSEVVDQVMHVDEENTKIWTHWSGDACWWREHQDQSFGSSGRREGYYSSLVRQLVFAQASFTYTVCKQYLNWTVVLRYEWMRLWDSHRAVFWFLWQTCLFP